MMASIPGLMASGSVPDIEAMVLWIAIASLVLLGDVAMTLLTLAGAVRGAGAIFCAIWMLPQACACAFIAYRLALDRDGRLLAAAALALSLGMGAVAIAARAHCFGRGGMWPGASAAPRRI
jgi:hypothetical protein